MTGKHAYRTMEILEATAGGRSYWYDKQHPEVTFIDLRVERDGAFYKRGYDIDNKKNYTILPDIQADYRKLPFLDSTFDLVVFDPPHFTSNQGMKKLSGIFRRKYGNLHAENWQRDIRLAFGELFRVMADHATLTFKFSDYHIGFTEILDQVPHEPMYGTTIRSGTHSTRWITFNKPNEMRSPENKVIESSSKTEATPHTVHPDQSTLNISSNTDSPSGISHRANMGDE